LVQKICTQQAFCILWKGPGYFSRGARQHEDG